MARGRWLCVEHPTTLHLKCCARKATAMRWTSGPLGVFCKFVTTRKGIHFCCFKLKNKISAHAHSPTRYLRSPRYTLLVGRPPFETSCLKETYNRIKKNSYTIPLVNWIKASHIVPWKYSMFFFLHMWLPPPCSTSTQRQRLWSSGCYTLIPPRGQPSLRCYRTTSSHLATSPQACPRHASPCHHASPLHPPQLWSLVRGAHWLLSTTRVMVPAWQADHTLQIILFAEIARCDELYSEKCCGIEMVVSSQQRQGTWGLRLNKGEECFFFLPQICPVKYQELLT